MENNPINFQLQAKAYSASLVDPKSWLQVVKFPSQVESWSHDLVDLQVVLTSSRHKTKPKWLPGLVWLACNFCFTVFNHTFTDWVYLQHVSVTFVVISMALHLTWENFNTAQNIHVFFCLSALVTHTCCCAGLGWFNASVASSAVQQRRISEVPTTRWRRHRYSN